MDVARVEILKVNLLIGNPIVSNQSKYYDGNSTTNERSS